MRSALGLPLRRLLTCGTDGNVLRLLPPIVMPKQLLAQGLDVIERAFETAIKDAMPNFNLADMDQGADPLR